MLAGNLPRQKVLKNKGTAGEYFPRGFLSFSSWNGLRVPHTTFPVCNGMMLLQKQAVRNISQCSLNFWKMLMIQADPSVFLLPNPGRISS